MSQHHLWLLCSCQGSKRHLDSVQSLKEPEAVVFEFLLQIQCLIRSFNISVLLTFWAGSLFAVGAVLFIAGCSTAWLVSAHLVSVTASSVITKNVSRHFQMSAEWQITIVEKDSLKAILCCYRTFLLPSHCPECSHMAIPNYKGGWVT